LHKGDEVVLGAYWCRVERCYEGGIPGRHEMLAIACDGLVSREAARYTAEQFANHRGLTFER